MPQTTRLVHARPRRGQRSTTLRGINACTSTEGTHRCNQHGMGLRDRRLGDMAGVTGSGPRIALMDEPKHRVRLTLSPRFYARTVFRIRSPLVPSVPTVANPSLRTSPEVPNQLHSGTAAIFSETTGKASTIPPPCFLIDSRAACSAILATPLPRWSRSTKKHVILHKLAIRTAGAPLR